MGKSLCFGCRRTFSLQTETTVLSANSKPEPKAMTLIFHRFGAAFLKAATFMRAMLGVPEQRKREFDCYSSRKTRIGEQRAAILLVRIILVVWIIVTVVVLWETAKQSALPSPYRHTSSSHGLLLTLSIRSAPPEIRRCFRAFCQSFTAIGLRLTHTRLPRLARLPV